MKGRRKGLVALGFWGGHRSAQDDPSAEPLQLWSLIMWHLLSWNDVRSCCFKAPRDLDVSLDRSCVFWKHRSLWKALHKLKAQTHWWEFPRRIEGLTASYLQPSGTDVHKSKCFQICGSKYSRETCEKRTVCAWSNVHIHKKRSEWGVMFRSSEVFLLWSSWCSPTSLGLYLQQPPGKFTYRLLGPHFQKRKRSSP